MYTHIKRFHRLATSTAACPCLQRGRKAHRHRRVTEAIREEPEREENRLPFRPAHDAIKQTVVHVRFVLGRHVINTAPRLIKRFDDTPGIYLQAPLGHA